MIASLQGNHGYLFYKVINKNKIRQSWIIYRVDYSCLLLYNLFNHPFYITQHISCTGEGDSGGVVIISHLQNLCPGLPDGQGICPTATTGWDGCSTFSQLGNLEGFLSAASSLAAFVVACTSGVPAGVIAMLWG